MSQQGPHSGKKRLIPLLMKLRGEKIQAIMKFKPTLTKAEQGVLTFDILYSTVEEGSLPILHLADQLGCRKI